MSISHTSFITFIAGGRSVRWGRDVPPDKLSFTMRREFEKAKEEAELIKQLRTVSCTPLRFLHFEVQYSYLMLIIHSHCSKLKPDLKWYYQRIWLLH